MPLPRFTWPLEIDDGLSSTFGEYRTNHLHGGIDLRTRQESGYKVLAAADGEIYRIKCERRGYGKAIYIRHADGWVTLYAHLQDFENEVLKLEDLLGSVQRNTGSPYPGTYYLDQPLRVSQGQVIAHAGESGAGLPHLHFETRIGEFEQVNPFDAGLAWRGDSTAPTLVSATLIPDGPAGRVMDQPRPLTVPFRKTNGSYSWAAPVKIEPPFRLLVTAFDVEGTPGNGCHVYSMRAFLDGEEIYTVRPDRFSLAPALRVGLIFDLNRNGKYPSAFTYSLDPRAPAYLPFTASRLPIQTLAPGPHRLEIQASDVWGNLSHAIGTLLVPVRAATVFGEPREVDAGAFELPWKIVGEGPADVSIAVSHDNAETFAPAAGLTGQAGVVKFNLGNPLLATKVLLEGRAVGSSIAANCAVAAVDVLSSPLSPVSSLSIDSTGRLAMTLRRPGAFLLTGVGFEPHEFLPLPTAGVNSTVVAFPRPMSRSKRLYAEIEFLDQHPISSLLIPWDVPPPTAVIDLLPARNSVALRLVFDRPRVDWDGKARGRFPDKSERPVDFARLDARTFLASLSPPPVSGRADIEANGVTIPLDVRRVHAESSQRFVSDDLIASFDTGAAYTDFFLWVQKDPPYADPRLVQVSDVYRLHPEGEPLARPARIQLHYPPAVHDPTKLGIFSWDPDGYWVYEATGIDRPHRLASTSVRRLGRYVLLEDRARPEIEFIAPRPGSSVPVASLPSILVEVTDYGKGVDDDTIQITLDGHRISAYYDPDRKWAAHVFHNPPKKGRHTLHVTARDHAGNAAIPASAVFYVK